MRFSRHISWWKNNTVRRQILIENMKCHFKQIGPTFWTATNLCGWHEHLAWQQRFLCGTDLLEACPFHKGSFHSSSEGATDWASFGRLANQDTALTPPDLLTRFFPCTTKPPPHTHNLPPTSLGVYHNCHKATPLPAARPKIVAKGLKQIAFSARVTVT